MSNGLSAAIVLTIALLSACDGGVYASGKVVDGQHRPIAGAHVTLSRGEHSREFTTTTTTDGCFYAGGVVPPGRYEYTLLVMADGYKFARAEVPTLETSYVEVTLQPQSSPAESRIAFVSQTTCP